ncbi:protein kinase domain-containing protein [Streptomyces wedmorensis]
MTSEIGVPKHAGDWSVPGYARERKLGSGASGQVILARHEDTGTPVAIKYLTRGLRSDRSFVAEFRAEARLLSSLHSPHVVQLYEYVESDQGAAIVMELVDGAVLRALLRQEGATAPEAALAVLKGSLLGLAAAHSAGVVHRDYKPENVLITADGDSKLVDFGIAARDGQSADLAGTPPYIAPEQWAGRPVSPAGDVYAATVTFFECLTGARPYTGSTPTELAAQHAKAPIPVDRVPKPLHSLILKGLAKTPEERPARAADLVDELEAIAATTYGEDWEERGRRRLAALVAMLPLLFSAGGSISGTTAMATTMVGPESPEPARLAQAPAPQHVEGPRRRMRGRRGKVFAGVASVALLAGGLAAVSAGKGGSSSVPHADGRAAATQRSDAALPGSSLSSTPHASVSTALPGSSLSSTPHASVPAASPGSSPSATPHASVPATSGEVSPFPGVTSGPEASTTLPASSGTPIAPTTPNPGSPPSAPQLHVYSVGISPADWGAGCSIQARITVRTDGAANGTLTLRWFHASSSSGTGSTTVATEQIPLPKGITQASRTYTHDFGFDRSAYLGVRASTSPSADSGDGSMTLVEAPISCNPPR